MIVIAHGLFENYFMQNSDWFAKWWFECSITVVATAYDTKQKPNENKSIPMPTVKQISSKLSCF